MQAVILCGGKGLRMSGAADFTCKPLVEVGGRPILWHIMKIYKIYGITEFILCLGHNGNHIKEYFLNQTWKNSDFHLSVDGEIRYSSPPEQWDIIFADTGQETMTGGRIKRIEKYINSERFMLTYGDAVADIPIDQLLAYHRYSGKIATVTGIRQRTGFGMMEVANGLVEEFQEKPLLDGWINGGFFVLEKKVFSYLSGDGCVWEEEPLKALSRDRELAVYQHQGFWQAMDTVKDVDVLNRLWQSNNRPWVKW